MPTQPEKHILKAGKLKGRSVSGQPPKTPLDELTDNTIQLPRLSEAIVKLYTVSQEEASRALADAPRDIENMETQLLPVSVTRATTRLSWRDDSWLIVIIFMSYITSIASF